MILLLHLLAAAAHARGASVDVELVRPSFSAGGPVGVDSPFLEQSGVLRMGTVLQYTRDPLVLYEYDQETGVVLSHRFSAHLGVSADISKGVSARVVLPAAAQWGSEVAALASDGPGLGDLRLGLRLVPALDGPLRAGLHFDLAVPTGTREAWLGEQTPRLNPGLLLGLRTGALMASLEAGVETRNAVDTGQDFVLGTEATGALGLRWDCWPDRAAVSTGLVARGGLSDLFTGAAENPAELLTSLQLWPDEALQLDLGVGKGLTEGYGTSELRALVGITFIRRPPPPPPSPLPSLAEVPVEDLPEPAEPAPAAPGWDEGQLARVEEDRIVIREPIQFALATARILEQSQPVLDQVAQVMHQDGSIGHLVVEGHASEEGSFSYNYELSIQRARAVWEALVAGGVHPSRVSYQGMGEVVPVASGEDEASRARNRRVDFRIVYRLEPGDPPPPSGEVHLPWSGAAVRAPAPPPLPLPPPPPDEEEEDAP